MTAIAASLLCCCGDDGGDEDPWPGSPCPGCAPYVDLSWDGSIELEARCCDEINRQCVPPHTCRPCEAHFDFGGDPCRDCPGHGCWIQKVNRTAFKIGGLRLFARPGTGARCQWSGIGIPQYFDINWCCTSALPDIPQCAHGDVVPLFNQGLVQFKAHISCLTYPSQGYVGTIWVRFGNLRCQRLDAWKPILNFVPYSGGNSCAACPDFITSPAWKPLALQTPFTLRTTCNIFPNYGTPPGGVAVPGCGHPDLDPVPWSAFDLGTVVKITAPPP